MLIRKHPRINSRGLSQLIADLFSHASGIRSNDRRSNFLTTSRPDFMGHRKLRLKIISTID
jgi:hypothetical protein